MAKGVRADGLSGERRQSGGRRRYVAFEDRPDAEAGDALAVGVQEQWRVWLGAVCPLTEIATEGVRGLLAQRADPLFALFPAKLRLRPTPVQRVAATAFRLLVVIPQWDQAVSRAAGFKPAGRV